MKESHSDLVMDSQTLSNEVSCKSQDIENFWKEDFNHSHNTEDALIDNHDFSNDTSSQ